ncbi:MAG: HD domain-containing protein [Oscillospiraceae bacterium]|nr:HD domain-containing protein [Oscillospiraceae bacterium]
MLPPSVLSVLRRLNDAGFAAYAVGGCVRDVLLGRVPVDWDVTTAARPEQVMALFPGQSIPTGLQHGTVTVRSGGMSVEVTTFRADGVYSDHRHPDEVRFSSDLAEDVKRRDFTVNAMTMDASGALTDLFGGRADLQNRVIRCVGDPQRRFEEDALRILRALRFASVLDFTVEPVTAAAIRALTPTLKCIAAERITAEMTKLLCGAAACRVLLEFPDVVGVFLPEVLPAVGFDQRNVHHVYDVWGHTAHAVGAAEDDGVVRWTMLFHDLGKPECFTLDDHGVGHFYGHGRHSLAMAMDAMARLKFSNEHRDQVAKLVDWHDRVIPVTPKGMRRCLNALGPEGTRRLIAVKRADNLAQAPAYRSRQQQLDEAEEIVADLLAQDACFSLKQLAVNGNDMTALGLRGSAVGDMLRALLEQVLAENLPNDREALLTWTKEHL